MNLLRHNGISETFVCRACMVEIDPVGSTYPGYTREQCDRGECPHCGGTDTAWMFSRYGCPCGSGLDRRELRDARGIYCGLICDQCEETKRSEFRPDIFHDAQYDADEDIDAEDDWGSGGLG